MRSSACGRVSSAAVVVLAALGCSACGFLPPSAIHAPRATTTTFHFSERLRFGLPKLLPRSTQHLFSRSSVGPLAVGTFAWRGNLVFGVTCYGTGSVTLQLGDSATTKPAPCKGLGSFLPTRTTLRGDGTRYITIYVTADPGTTWTFAVGEKIATSATA